MKPGAFDAVISSNDEMAMEVIQYFRNLSRDGRCDIRVTGFDDIEKSRFSSPSLTTVRQPVYHIGKKACEMIIDIINNGSGPRAVEIDSLLIIRESCGCGTGDQYELPGKAAGSRDARTETLDYFVKNRQMFYFANPATGGMTSISVHSGAHRTTGSSSRKNRKPGDDEFPIPHGD